MTYCNLMFLGIFLPLTIIIYNLVPQKHRWKILLIASYIFFWSISGKLLIYLLLTTLSMHYFGLWITVIQNERDGILQTTEKEKKKEIKEVYAKKQKKLMLVVVLIQLAILIILKYSPFFGRNLNSLLEVLNIPFRLKIHKFIIPIGISFYTLQAISYMIDVYRGTIKADKNLGRLALFISFFPQIMEGPICRYSQTAEQLWKCEKVTYESLIYGLQRIGFGLMKKMIIADRLNPFVIDVFDKYACYDGGIVAVGMSLYTLQLYMDFSGVMDIVIGVGEIFGVKLPENFKQPFFSKSISEFWMRWHITLGAWFRDYIYYPVSLTNKCKKMTTAARKKFGNYYGPLMTSTIALFCVWICNGIWHGSAWNYIFFGLYHFGLILLGRIIEPIVEKCKNKLHITNKNYIYNGFRIIKTTCLVFVGELFFRANGFVAGFAMFKEMVTNFSFKLINDGTILKLGLDRQDFIVIAITVLVVFITSIMKEKGIDIRKEISKKNIVVRWIIYYALILSIIIFGAYGVGYAAVDPMYAQF